MKLKLTIEGRELEITCKAKDAFIIEQAIAAPSPTKHKRGPASPQDYADAMTKAKAYAIANKCTAKVNDFLPMDI